MKAIVFEQFGTPSDVLKIREVLAKEPGQGEVRVRMLASPVNPSDLMSIRGLYGRLPTLPAIPGFEGVGVIDSIGAGWIAKLRGLKPGRRVAVLNGPGGNWQQLVVISARNVVPISDDIPDEQAASFFVNPATAIIMTRRVLQLQSGTWLLQTAAGSALGRMVIRLGRHVGFRTINLVRRPELVQELKSLGADAVLVVGQHDIPAQVRSLTGGAGVPAALDCVGGAGVSELLQSLAPRGRLLVYGTLSGEDVSLNPRLLMTGQKSYEGFWLSDWVRTQRPWTMLRLFKEITSLMRAGVLTSPVAESFGMDQVAEAVKAAERPGKPGKVLLRFE